MKVFKKTKLTKAYEQDKLREAVDDGTTLDQGTYIPPGEARTDLIDGWKAIAEGRAKGTDVMKQKAAKDREYILKVAHQLKQKGYEPHQLVGIIKARAGRDGKKMGVDKIRAVLQDEESVKRNTKP